MDDLRVQDLPAYHHLHPIFGSLFSQLKNLIRSDNSAAMIPTHVFGNVKFFSQVAHCIGLELKGRFGKHCGQGYRMIHVVIENRMIVAQYLGSLVVRNYVLRDISGGYILQTILNLERDGLPSPSHKI